MHIPAAAGRFRLAAAAAERCRLRACRADAARRRGGRPRGRLPHGAAPRPQGAGPTVLSLSFVGLPPLVAHYPWPPEAGPLDSRIRCALGTSCRAAQGPLWSCSAAAGVVHSAGPAHPGAGRVRRDVPHALQLGSHSLHGTHRAQGGASIACQNTPTPPPSPYAPHLTRLTWRASPCAPYSKARSTPQPVPLHSPHAALDPWPLTCSPAGASAWGRIHGASRRYGGHYCGRRVQPSTGGLPERERPSDRVGGY